MHCATIKLGQDCGFMTVEGCSFNGGNCHPVVEACDGCARIIDLDAGLFCQACPEPAAKWRLGVCNLATHVKDRVEDGGNGKLNPLKASKRNNRR